jgi:uncharacterized protein
MRVLHYSDHQDERLSEFFDQSDILIATGDLSGFDFSSIENRIQEKPSFGVYGNHDAPEYLERLGIQNVHLKIVDFNGMKIGGYQGCPRYKDGGGPQYTEEEAIRDLANFPAVDILLLHAAPRGLLDTPGDPVHTGSQAVRDYVDSTKPKYIFCGHDSPSLELDHNGTKIFRTDKARIIDIYA